MLYLISYILYLYIYENGGTGDDENLTRRASGLVAEALVIRLMDAILHYLPSIPNSRKHVRFVVWRKLDFAHEKSGGWMIIRGVASQFMNFEVPPNLSLVLPSLEAPAWTQSNKVGFFAGGEFGPVGLRTESLHVFSNCYGRL